MKDLYKLKKNGMKGLERLLERNMAWVREKGSNRTDLPGSNSRESRPEVLWIGCSELYLPLAEMTGLSPDQMLVHLNLANLFVPKDINGLSIVRYAVETLKVSEIVVCGHHGCSGVVAAAGRDDVGPLGDWLVHVSDQSNLLPAVEDSSLSEVVRQKRLVELNVKVQVRRLANHPIIRNAWRRGEDLAIHGLVYDPDTGLFEDIGVSLNSEAAYLVQEDDPLSGNHREGIVILGAGPTARALYRVLARTEEVYLVDSNPEYCEFAVLENMNVVNGNVLDEHVLAKAHVARARTLIVMTPDTEVNALAVRLASEVFSVPEILLLNTDNNDEHQELRKRFGTTTLFAGPLDLKAWDLHVDHADAVTTALIVQEQAGRSAKQLYREVTDDPIPGVPIAYVRNNRHYPFHEETVLQRGDRVILLRMTEARYQPFDRFDRFVWRAVILDIDRPLNASELFEMAAVSLAPQLDITAEELAGRFADRELTSSTVVLPGLAIPHVLIEGENKFVMLMARCRGGVAFPGQPERVHTVFMLASTRDQRNTHLRVLAAIANLVHWPDFEVRWLEAPDAEALRDLVVHAPRRRLPESAAV